MNKQIFRIMLAATAFALSAGASFAQVIITHEKALAGNVAAGDSPGYPVTLAVPGHYKLASNLLPPAYAGGIDITGPGITLDLNGFVISGGGSCTRNASTRQVTCAHNFINDRHGIWIKSTGIAAVVRNGTVSGFGDTGIVAAIDSTLEKLTVMFNHGGGIIAPANDAVKVADSLIHYNLGPGINGASVVERTRVFNNNGNGIMGGFVSECLVVGNLSTGLQQGRYRATLSSNNGIDEAYGYSMGGNMLGGATPF